MERLWAATPPCSRRDTARVRKFAEEKVPMMTMTSSLPWSWSLSILDQRRVPNPRTFQWFLNWEFNRRRIFNREVSSFISPNIAKVLKYLGLFKGKMKNILHVYIIYKPKNLSRFLLIAFINYTNILLPIPMYCWMISLRPTQGSCSNLPPSSAGTYQSAVRTAMTLARLLLRLAIYAGLWTMGHQKSEWRHWIRHRNLLWFSNSRVHAIPT